MTKNIVITGGAGFIGSNLVKFLNQRGVRPIIVEKNKNLGEKWKNLVGADFDLLFYSELKYAHLKGENQILVDLGANTDTTEEFNDDLWSNNVEKTQKLFSLNWDKIIYASSASVYGNLPYEKCHEENWDLKPLNAYAYTKYFIDKILFKDNYKEQLKCKSIFGLRFFNVYSNDDSELHKGAMQSVVSKFLHQKDKNTFKLFRSDKKIERDFVFVEDVCKVIDFFIFAEEEVKSGVYNLGSGVAAPFNDIPKLINKNAKIGDINMPEKLKDQYQYFTQANISKLRKAGYKEEFKNLKEILLKNG